MGIYSYIAEKKAELKQARQLTQEERLQILEQETQQTRNNITLYATTNESRQEYEQAKIQETRTKHPIITSIAESIKNKFSQSHKENAGRNIFATNYEEPPDDEDNVFRANKKKVFGQEPYQNPFLK